MATYNLKRFSSPGALKTINRGYLLALLVRYDSYFNDRGLTLPPQSDSGALDYELLTTVLMNPGKDTPPGLADALYFVHEMATSERMDVLLSAAEENGIPIDGSPDPTAADVAIQVYLKDKDLLERKHAEQQVTTRRSFEYFGTDVYPVPEFNQPTPESLSALEAELDEWFASRRRGRGSRIFVFPKEDAVWFLLRHGEPFTREGTFEGNEPFVFFRPEKYDVLIYDRLFSDIRMNVCSEGEKKLFRQKFGFYLFGNENFFNKRKKYTLEPLRNGESSIACTDVSGMESVTLKEVRFRWGGKENEVEIRQADDVFAAYKSRERDMPAKLPITMARFEVKFTGSKAPRSITIGPSFANYTRDSDSAVVLGWLEKRLFTLNGQVNEQRVKQIMEGS